MEMEVRDEMHMTDMLCLFGHRALGLTIHDALEIDPMYRYHLELYY